MLFSLAFYFVVQRHHQIVCAVHFVLKHEENQLELGRHFPDIGVFSVFGELFSEIILQHILHAAFLIRKIYPEAACDKLVIQGHVLKLIPVLFKNAFFFVIIAD